MSADLPSEYRAGVGIVLCNRHGQVLIGRRRDDRRPPWQMPQGGIQPDETPTQAARRELREELGIDDASLIECRADWLSYDYPTRSASRRTDDFRGQRHLWFLLRFDGEDGDIRIDSPHGEFSDWRWSSVDEVIDRVVDFKRPIYRQVLRGFAPALLRMRRPPAAKAAEPVRQLTA